MPYPPLLTYPLLTYPPLMLYPPLLTYSPLLPYPPPIQIQTVTCSLGGGTSAGSFMLSFRSQKTAAIEYDSTEGEIKDALELLSTIGAVEVTFATGNTEACIGAGNAIAVNFTSELGNVPALVSSDLSSLGGGTGERSNHP